MGENEDPWVISADSHVIEAHDLWLEYADPAFLDRVPRLVRRDDCDMLVGEEYEGHVGLLSGVARKGEEVKVDGRWDEDVFPGGYDPAQRLHDLERDAVVAEVLFPTVGLSFYSITDLDLQWALFDAYNRWLADFCGYRPEVFHGIGMITTDDVGRATAALRSCKEQGHVGVMVPLFGTDYSAPELDPFWAVAAELELPVNLHSSTFRRHSESFFGQATFVDRMLNTPYRIQKVLFQLTFAGVFDRYPELRVVSTENDAGWASHSIERADYWWERQRSLVPDDEVRCERPPSFYFHENIRHAFMRDHAAILSREIIGMNTLMWGNDFPHHISTWPDSQELVTEYGADLTKAEHRALFCQNVRDVYGF